MVLLGLTVLLDLLSARLDPWHNPVSLSEHLHVGTWRHRIVFFNQREYGPYSGSVVSIVDSQGNRYPPIEREIKFGDTLGIYYRYFRWTDSTLWTLMVSLAYPAAAFAALPAYRVARRLRRFLRRRRIKPGHCTTCGYDLTGNTTGRCPECGTARPTR